MECSFAVTEQASALPPHFRNVLDFAILRTSSRTGTRRHRHFNWIFWTPGKELGGEGCGRVLPHIYRTYTQPTYQDMSFRTKTTAPVPTESDLPQSNMSPSTSSQPTFKHLTIQSHSGGVYVITMCKPPENRLNVAFAQTLMRALRHIESLIGPNAPGAVVIKGSDMKFWCTGLELDESDSNPYANSDGFYPLLAMLLDYPFPTVACITGHTFGGAGPFALAHDYRIMNSKRGFFSMPPVDLGLHFNGIGALPRLKLGGRVARKMLLEAYRWTGEEALKDGVVDEVCEPEGLERRAIERARELAPRATMGVFGLLRSELWGEALERFRQISYTHRRREGTVPKAKI